MAVQKPQVNHLPHLRHHLTSQYKISFVNVIGIINITGKWMEFPESRNVQSSASAKMKYITIYSKNEIKLNNKISKLCMVYCEYINFKQPINSTKIGILNQNLLCNQLQHTYIQCNLSNCCDFAINEVRILDSFAN